MPDYPIPDYSINEEDMIQPVQSGTNLMDDIATSQAAPNQVLIWWLGQSGYAIRTHSELFFIDLYLSEHLTEKYRNTAKPHIRITHSPLRGSDLRDVKWLFSSHKHSDHLDPGTVPDLMQGNPQARLIMPAAITEHAAAMGLDSERFISTNGDETFQAGSLTVHSIPSAHEDFDYEEGRGYPYVGYVIQVDGITLYHSGDTVLYAGLADRLKVLDVDIAFLPINGTDDLRHRLSVPPNMGIDDALTLAAQIGRPLLIPHHYDMFTFNTVDVKEFEKAAQIANQPYRVLRCGEKFIYQQN